MLSVELGYRAPSAVELARIALRYARERITGRGRPAGTSSIQASLISDEPLISYSGIGWAPLGLASVLPRLPRRHRAWFLISPTWSMEQEYLAEATRAHAVLHRLRHPRHALIFMGNTPAEMALLRRHGEAAFFHNKTSSVSEAVFRPLDGVPVEFDAIYNAQLAPWKRHELSLGIERCAFVFYRGDFGAATRQAEAALFDRHASLAPGHVFVNRIDEHGTPVRMRPAEVNRQLNRAAVGLCLSETEGAMFASTEYLLAGLPVVTTPSRGGRHIYLDEDYCLTVPPDPRSIAQAVAALKARQIPRTYIRTRTLERLDRDRARFIELVNAILAESGAERRLKMPWPFKQPVIMEWLDPKTAVSRVLSGIVDAFGEAAPGKRQKQADAPGRASGLDQGLPGQGS